MKYNLILENGESLIFEDLSWGDNIDSLGMELSFNVPVNLQDKYLKNHNKVTIGEKFSLIREDNKNIFSGIIVDLGTSRFSRSITALDFGFYLNQSKAIKQFNKIRADKAIKDVLLEFKIPIGEIASMGTIITKIYNGSTVSEIIKDILKQVTDETGQKFRMEIRDNKLYIENYKDLIIVPKFKPAKNIESFNPLNYIGEISKSESIQDMKNKIVITSGDEKKAKVVATVQDDDSISKFGLLTEIESVDKKELSQARNIANNKLKDLNKVKEELSITLLGDDEVRSGRIIKLSEEDWELDGYYLIVNSNHTYSNSIRTMNLTLEKVEI